MKYLNIVKHTIPIVIHEFPSHNLSKGQYKHFNILDAVNIPDGSFGEVFLSYWDERRALNRSN
jgi:hypothetical protein